MRPCNLLKKDSAPWSYLVINMITTHLAPTHLLCKIPPPPSPPKIRHTIQVYMTGNKNYLMQHVLKRQTFGFYAINSGVCLCKCHEGMGSRHLEVSYDHYETCSTQTQKERSADSPANILFKQMDSLTYIIPLSKMEYCV